MKNIGQIKIRNITPADYTKIIEVMPEWWGGRDLTSSVLKVFFIYFCDTSYVVEANGKIVGFLIGFLSQVKQHEAYIHFAGVDPEFRKQGVGRKLYKKFFESCKSRSVKVIRSCTSPINRLSIQFHKAIGFKILPGDAIVDDFPVSTTFLKDNDPKVIFEIEI